MRRFSTFTLLLLVAALVMLPAIAQEQVGSVEGIVKDNSGAVLPGVTVELTSSSIGTLATTTDARGHYRFPRVPSGVYAVKASLMG
jgi:protocatechuate 3,4-dioxygenase beta subunit